MTDSGCPGYLNQNDNYPNKEEVTKNHIMMIVQLLFLKIFQIKIIIMIMVNNLIIINRLMIIIIIIIHKIFQIIIQVIQDIIMLSI